MAELPKRRRIMGPQFVVPPPFQSITAQFLMKVDQLHVPNFSINFLLLNFKIGSDFWVSNIQVWQAVMQEAILAI